MMKDQIKQAAQDGLIFGVKWGVVLLVLGSIFMLTVGDYARVRQQAAFGAAARDWIVAGVKAGQIPAEWKAASPAPAAPEVKK